MANVAGGSGPGFGLGPLLGVPADEFRRVLDVNVVGTWLVSKACATRMVAEGVGGRICNVSSQAGKRAFPFLGPYCAAKAGVILLTQTMALELGPAGIAVNAVCPGTVDTDLINKDAMFENLMGGPEGLAAYIAREIPLGPPAERRGDRRRHLLAALGRGPGRHRRGVERERRTDNGVAMPILDARHDLAHPVEGDSAWSESYYFNAYDPGTDSGLFSRIGIRPNEGTMDVGLSLWLPGGELGEYRWVKEQREMVDTVLEVGAVRYEMLEAVQSWRLTVEGEVQARPCVRGETAAHPVRVALDVRFDALTPAIGTDGQPRGGPRSAEAAAAAGTVGKGHLEQAGRWTGSLTVDGVRHEWQRRARQPRPLLGPAPLGRAEDVALVLHQLRRGHALRRHPPRHRRRRPAPGLGLGRRPGRLGRRVAGADRAGRRRGDAPRGAPRRGRQGGPHLSPPGRRAAGGRHRPGRRHHGQRGAGPLDLRGPGRRTRTGYGICEYLHQLDDAGRPVVPVE